MRYGALDGARTDSRLNGPHQVYEDWHGRRVYCPLIVAVLDDAERAGQGLGGFRKADRFHPAVAGKAVGPLLPARDAVQFANEVAAGHREVEEPNAVAGQDLLAGAERYQLVRNNGMGGWRDIIATADSPQDLLPLAARLTARGVKGIGMIDGEPGEGAPENHMDEEFCP